MKLFLVVTRWDKMFWREETFVEETTEETIKEKGGYDALFNPGGHWEIDVAEFRTEEEALEYLG